MPFGMSRRIEIDMAHRVPTHGSKCWNVHGHRYVIIAEAQSQALQEGGEQTDMVVDFGFLKNVMVGQIYDFCDHGMCLWIDDPWLDRFLLRHTSKARKVCEEEGWYFEPEDKALAQTKLLVVNFIPTAERLAEFWFRRMLAGVSQISGGKAALSQVVVQETPNGIAYYPPTMKAAPGSMFTSLIRDNMGTTNV